jgi:hypothetical protein
MGTFTIRLCDLIDQGFDLGMTAADYPIFDEPLPPDVVGHRVGLNQRITDHFAFYEIGHETPEQFRFALNRKMREIMPYYNQLYLSEKIQFDPLSTMDFTDDTTAHNTTDSTNNATNHNTNNASSKSRVTNSELPQVHLSPNEDYASSGADTASETDSSGDATATTTGNDTVDGTVNHATTGRQGAAATLLMNYRASLLNIDMMVVQECGELFMGVWNTSDDYSTAERTGNASFTYPYLG